MPVRQSWSTSGSPAVQYEVWLSTDAGPYVKQALAAPGSAAAVFPLAFFGMLLAALVSQRLLGLDDTAAAAAFGLLGGAVVLLHQRHRLRPSAV